MSLCIVRAWKQKKKIKSLLLIQNHPYMSANIVLDTILLIWIGSQKKWSYIYHQRIQEEEWTSDIWKKVNMTWQQLRKQDLSKNRELVERKMRKWVFIINLSTLWSVKTQTLKIILLFTNSMACIGRRERNLTGLTVLIFFEQIL